MESLFFNGIGRRGWCNLVESCMSPQACQTSLACRMIKIFFKGAFTTKGEQTAPHFPEKLCLQQQSEFQELLQIFWETSCLNSWELVLLAFNLHRQWQHGFLHKTGFLCFKFSTSHFIAGQVLSKNKKFSILRVIHATAANSVINTCKHAYIHTHKHIYIWKVQMRLTSGTGNPGWSRMQPDLVCCKWLGSNESEHTFMITE